MKLILNIILIALVISTISICAIKPDMHKSVVVYDSAYKIIPEQQIEVEKEVIPIMEKTVETVKTSPKEANPPKIEVKQIKSTPVKTTVSKNIAKQEMPRTTVQKAPQNMSKTVTSVSTVKPKTETVQQKLTKTIKEPTTKDNITVQQPPKVVSKTVPEPAAIKTISEEEIAWNTWRSNLQNKIMQDVKLPLIPTGIVFKFSFTVDKYGKVSNVQTWSTTSAYTPYAIQYIAPVIRSYQGKSILTFPSGTARMTTQVTGGWKISDNEIYSSPKDYNDVEKIRVTR